MKYEIKGQEKSTESVLKLSFYEQSDGSITIYGEDNRGSIWNFLTLQTDGTFFRSESLPDNIGLQVDERGRIKEC